MDAFADVGGDFLLVLFQRRPELADLLNCSSGVVGAEASDRALVAGSAGAKRFRKSPASFTVGPRTSICSNGHRKLSLKAHIEGLPWVRPEASPQAGEPSALAPWETTGDGSASYTESGGTGDDVLNTNSEGADRALRHSVQAVPAAAANVPSAPSTRVDSRCDAPCHNADGGEEIAGLGVPLEAQGSFAGSLIPRDHACKAIAQRFLDSTASFCGSCDSSSAATTHSGAAASTAGSVAGGLEVEHEAPAPEPGGKAPGPEAADAAAAGPFAAALANAAIASTAAPAAAATGSSDCPRPPLLLRPTTPAGWRTTPTGRMSPSGRRLMSRGCSVSPMPSLVMQLNGGRIAARELMASASAAARGGQTPDGGTPDGGASRHGCAGGKGPAAVRSSTPSGPASSTQCSGPEPAAPLSRKASLQPITLLLPSLPSAPTPRKLMSVRSLALLRQQQQQQEQQGQQPEQQGEGQRREEQQHEQLVRVPDPLCLNAGEGCATGASGTAGGDGSGLSDSPEQGLQPPEASPSVETTPWSQGVADDLHVLLEAPMLLPRPSALVAELSAELRQLSRRLRRTLSSPERPPVAAAAPCQPQRVTVSSPSRLPPYLRSLPLLGEAAAYGAGGEGGGGAEADTGLPSLTRRLLELPAGMALSLRPLRVPPSLSSSGAAPPAATQQLRGRAANARRSSLSSYEAAPGTEQPAMARSGAGGADSEGDPGSGAPPGVVVRGGPGGRGTAGASVVAIARQTLELPVRRRSQHLSPLGAVASRSLQRGGFAPLLAFGNRGAGHGQQLHGTRRRLQDGTPQTVPASGGDGGAYATAARGANGRSSAPSGLSEGSSDSGAVGDGPVGLPHEKRAPSMPSHGSPPLSSRSAPSPRTTAGVVSPPDDDGARHADPSVDHPAPPPALPLLAHRHHNHHHHHGGAGEAVAGHGGFRGQSVQSVRGRAVNPARQHVRAVRNPTAPSPESCHHVEDPGGGCAFPAGSGITERPGGPGAAGAVGASVAAKDAPNPVPKLRQHHFGARSQGVFPVPPLSTVLQGIRSPRSCGDSAPGRPQSLLPSISSPTGASAGPQPRRGASLVPAAATVTAPKTG